MASIFDWTVMRPSVFPSGVVAPMGGLQYALLGDKFISDALKAGHKCDQLLEDARGAVKEAEAEIWKEVQQRLRGPEPDQSVRIETDLRHCLLLYILYAVKHLKAQVAERQALHNEGYDVLDNFGQQAMHESIEPDVEWDAIQPAPETPIGHVNQTRYKFQDIARSGSDSEAGFVSRMHDASKANSDDNEWEFTPREPEYFDLASPDRNESKSHPANDSKPKNQNKNASFVRMAWGWAKGASISQQK